MTAPLYRHFSPESRDNRLLTSLGNFNLTKLLLLLAYCVLFIVP